MSGRRFEVSGTQVVASVLATVTGAIAASYLGVAGTIIGAAVMSIASTAGSAVYKDYLGRTARRLREAAPVITQRTTQRATAAAARSTARRLFQPEDSERTLTSAVTDAGEVLPDPGTEPRPQTRLRARPGWLMAVGAAAGIFLTVIAAITVFELAAGRPLEAVVWHRHTSGTSVGQIVGGPARARAPATGRAHPASPSGGAASTPAVTPTSPSPSPSPTTSSGSPSPSPTGTGSPSPGGSPTRSPRG